MCVCVCAQKQKKDIFLIQNYTEIRQRFYVSESVCEPNATMHNHFLNVPDAEREDFKDFEHNLITQVAKKKKKGTKRFLLQLM